MDWVDPQVWLSWVQIFWGYIDPQRTLSYFWGFTPLCQIWWKSTRKCDRESDDTRTDTQTDRQTDRQTQTDFIICPIAIAYSYGTDNHKIHLSTKTDRPTEHIKHFMRLTTTVRLEKRIIFTNRIVCNKPQFVLFLCARCDKRLDVYMFYKTRQFSRTWIWSESEVTCFETVFL